MGCGYSCGMGMNPIQPQRYVPLSISSSPTDQIRLNSTPPLMPSLHNSFNPQDSYQKQGSAMPYASMEQGHSAAYIKSCDKDNRPAAVKYGNTAYWNVSGV